LFGVLNKTKDKETEREDEVMIEAGALGVGTDGVTLEEQHIERSGR
jgi:hypothetical protein